MFIASLLSYMCLIHTFHLRSHWNSVEQHAGQSERLVHQVPQRLAVDVERDAVSGGQVDESGIGHRIFGRGSEPIDWTPRIFVVFPQMEHGPDAARERGGDGETVESGGRRREEAAGGVDGAADVGALPGERHRPVGRRGDRPADEGSRLEIDGQREEFRRVVLVGAPLSAAGIELFRPVGESAHLEVDGGIGGLDRRFETWTNATDLLVSLGSQ